MGEAVGHFAAIADRVLNAWTLITARGNTTVIIIRKAKAAQSNQSRGDRALRLLLSPFNRAIAAKSSIICLLGFRVVSFLSSLD